MQTMIKLMKTKSAREYEYQLYCLPTGFIIFIYKTKISVNL